MTELRRAAIVVGVGAVACLLALSWRAAEEQRPLDLGDLRAALFVALMLAAVLWLDPGRTRARLPEEERTHNSFDRFDASARAAIVAAQAEATKLGHNYIGTEHLLLGLLVATESRAAQLIVAGGLDLAGARLEVERIIDRGASTVEGALVLTPRSKRVIAQAIEVADRLGHPEITDRHLLSALIQEGEGIGAGLLGQAGIDLAALRQAAERSDDEPHPAGQVAVDQS